MEVQGRSALVVGAGVSGRAAAKFLLARGARVDLYDDAPRERLGTAALALGDAGVRLLTGGPRIDPRSYDLAVVSPGVPAGAPLVQTIGAAGVEVLGEVELAARFLGTPVLAVTGTNGKTTVTELLGQIVRSAGQRVFVGGNLGTPLIEAAGGDWDWVVAEISSFQLETIRAFRPRVAILLNITDDHFDRHRDLAAYVGAKARIFHNQGSGDAAVVNADDANARAAARKVRSALLPYSTKHILTEGAWAVEGEVRFRLPDRAEVRLPRVELALPGLHNLGNAMAACLAAAWIGVELSRAWAEASSFRGLPHRIQTFLEWRGIRFVDDSKGTNVGAALRALETVQGPVVWVAGGVDKGGDYGPLAAKIRGLARQVVLVGAASEAMAQALRGAAPIVVAEDWPGAVRTAVASAEPGDTVLLSPACSSFDFFSGYAERGDVFQRLCRDEILRIETDGR